MPRPQPCFSWKFRATPRIPPTPLRQARRLLTDENFVPGGKYATGQFLYASGFPGNFINTSDGAVHTGGSDYLAADGHVKWLRPIAVSAGFGEMNAGASACAAQPNNVQAACTSNLTAANGNVFQLTFSPY